MEFTLTVQADTLSAEALQDLTRDLCRTLNREADVRATMIEAPAVPGARGIEAISGILIHGGGVVVGELVLELLKPYFHRIGNLIIKILLGRDGNELSLDAESVQPEHLDRTVKRINSVLKLANIR